MLYLTLSLLGNYLLFQLREGITSNYSENACTRIIRLVKDTFMDVARGIRA